MQTFPAPWRGGSYTVLHVGIYLPPGYASGARTYPVIYEAPFTYRSWQIGTSIAPTLDQLITSGTIPPAIVVFVPATGGPYPDAECANSADGREWLDRFISTTLVDWVDASYRTIPTPAARTVLGFSQGGYCAAALTLRHPDVFGSAVSISGYFSAGIRSSETPNAWRPFGRLPALIAADSPMRLAETIAPVVRRSIFVVLVAQPGNPFFGGQAAAFAGVLERAGYPLAVIAAGRGHSWGQVRSVLAAALELVALRQARLGVPLNG